jgi:hypothetical protein
MPERELLWAEGGPDERTLAEAYRDLFGRELDLERYLFVEELGWATRYHMHDDTEVTVAFEGGCKIERPLRRGSGASVCSAHRVPEPGCPLCGVRREGGGGGAG